MAQDKLLLTVSVSPVLSACAHDSLQALKSVKFRWTVYPLLDPCLKPPADDDSKKAHESDCDKWIRLFLCCMALESQAGRVSRYVYFNEIMLITEKFSGMNALIYWTANSRHKLTEIGSVGYD